MKITDIEKIREVVKTFLYLDLIPNPVIPMFVDHPIFSSPISMNQNGELVDILNNEEELENVRKKLGEEISSSSLDKLFMIVRANYHLTLLKFAKPYFGKKDFDEYLAYVWVNSENPNQDVNVNIKTLIKWFTAADRKNLMDKKELEVFDSLSDTVNIYRGIAVGRAEKEGLSWTCNYDTANWFAHRFDRKENKGYIIKGTIKKEDIFAYFNRRGEDEILCNSSKVYDIEKLTA